MLIYLYLFINYNTYNKTYEKFTDNVVEYTLDVVPTSSADNGTSAVQIPPRREYDGSSITYALGGASHITAINSLRGSTGTILGSGYYWVFLPIIGKKLVFLKVETSPTGAGEFWVLAMRGSKNSGRFRYDSKYWTTNSTFNAKSNRILTTNYSNTGTVLFNRQEGIHSFNSDLRESFAISSIGNKIYNNVSTDIYDAKFDVYNHYNFSEVMVIIYTTKDDALKRYDKITMNFTRETATRSNIVPLLMAFTKTGLTDTVKEGGEININTRITATSDRIRFGIKNQTEVSGIGFSQNNNAYASGTKTGTTAMTNYGFELYVR